MTLEQTAAAYGLFQLVYADLTENLAVAVFELRKRTDPALVFEQVFRSGFKQLLHTFRQLIKQFAGDSAVGDSVSAVSEACEIMSTLRDWRNDRLHARLRITEDGYALYDWRTRRRLAMNSEEIDSKLQLGIKAIVILQAHMPHLLHNLDFEAEVERLFVQMRGGAAADEGDIDLNAKDDS